MKGAEVLAVIIYFASIFSCMDHWFTWKVVKGDLDLIIEGLSKSNKSDFYYQISLTEAFGILEPRYFKE